MKPITKSIYIILLLLSCYGYHTAYAQVFSPYQLLITPKNASKAQLEDLDCLRECFEIDLVKKLAHGLQLWDWTKPGTPKFSHEKMAEIVRYNFPEFKVQPNYLYRLNSTIPNDPLFGEQWNLYNTGDNGCVEGADIGTVDVWDQTTGDSSIVIAILDGGMDLDHEDLIKNLWTNPYEIPGNGIDDDNNDFVDDIHGWNFAYDSTYTGHRGYPEDDTENGHGTHVAGIIGAEGGNGKGIAGVCWSCKLLPVKFTDSLGVGSSLSAINALNYIADLKESGVNIKVVNNSWGGTANDFALYEAIERLNILGVLVVSAAGNSNQNNNDLNPYYPASFDLPNIISVAAIDCHAQLTSFSNYGSISVDLAAPGTAILSTIPDNKYEILSGTSMAAPHVTGAIALLFSSLPYSTPYSVKQRLIDLVEPLPDLTNRCLAQGGVNVKQAVTNNRITTFQKAYALPLAFPILKNIQQFKNENYFLNGLIRESMSTPSSADDQNTIYLQYIDKIGNIQWAKKIRNGVHYSASYSSHLTNDKGIVVTGEILTQDQSVNSINRRPLVFKLDTLGNILWSKVYSSPSMSNSNSLNSELARDNSILTAGTAIFTNIGRRVFILKSDSLGNPIWMKTFEGSNAANNIIETLDNGLLVGSYSTNEISLLKTDSEGHFLWSKKLLNDARIWLTSIIETDDKILIAGRLEQGINNNRNGFLLKIDHSGNFEWLRIFDASKDDGVFGLTETFDGNYLVTVTSIEQPDPSGKLFGQTFVISLLPNGGMNWVKEINLDTTNTFIQNCFPTNDGGIMSFGSKGDYASDVDIDINYAAFLSKSDVYIESGCNEFLSGNLQITETNTISSSVWKDFFPDTNTLQVTSNDINLESLSVDITDSIQVVTNCISSLECNLTVKFQTLRNTFCLGDTMKFMNNSVGADEYIWYVNDSIFSHEQTPSLTLNKKGTHKIKLEGRKNNCSLVSERNVLIKTPVNIDLASDTATLASAIYLNGSTENADTYIWKDSLGDVISNFPYIGLHESGLYSLTVGDACGNTDTDSIRVTFNGNGQYILPGDVNADGLINLFDWMLLSLEQGARGEQRVNGSTAPIPQQSNDWSQFFPDNHFLAPGINYKHGDCDGDGKWDVFKDGDIVLKYINSIHPNLNDPNSPYTLRFKLLNRSIKIGDTLQFELILNNYGGIDSLYGLIASIDQSIPLENSPIIEATNFWGESENSAAQGVFYDAEEGRSDFSFARVGLPPITLPNFDVTGRGRIITQIEDLNDPWLFSKKFPLTFTPGNALLVGQDTLIPINGVSAQSTSTVMVEIPSDLVFAKIRNLQSCINSGSRQIEINVAQKNVAQISLWRRMNDGDSIFISQLESRSDTITMDTTYLFTDTSPSNMGDSIHYFLKVEGPNGKIYQTSLWNSLNTEVCETSVNNPVFPKVDLKVFPNPSQGVFQIELEFERSSGTPASLVISNMLGIPVWKKHLLAQPNKLSMSVDLAHLSSGIYFVTFFSGQLKKTEKIILYNP